MVFMVISYYLGSQLSGLCEGWLISTYIQLHLRSFVTAQDHATAGKSIDVALTLSLTC